MKKIVKQRVAVLLCVAMLISMVSPGIRSFADTKDGQAAYSVSGSYVNPVYADTPGMEETEISTVDRQSSLDGICCTSIEEAGNVLRQAMVNRDESLEIYLIFVRESPETDSAILDAKAARLTDQIVAEALKHTGRVKEGDYLSMQYSSIDYQICFAIEDGDYTKATFRPRFTTTKEEEKRLDEEIAKIKDELKLSEKNDYEKIKAIYDWMITNVQYDHAALPGENMHVYSPYGAIVNRSCICQGYAMGLSRLLGEAGISSRVITGYGGKPFNYQNSHAWNLVKLEGKYYYLDPTWEANEYENTGKMRHLYFLHGSSDWLNHFPGNESLLRQYNISFENYEKQQVVQGGSDMSNNSFGIFVVDEKGNPVPEAAVTMLTFSGYTDKDGFVSFEIKGTLGFNRIRAKKEGYLIGVTTANVKVGSTCTIELSPDEEEMVIEVEASYGDKITDLLSDYVPFNEYVEDSERDTSGDTTSVLTLNIRTYPEQTGLYYEIWSGDSKVAQTGSPIIDFTVYELSADEDVNYVYPCLKDFKAEKDVRLRVYQNGSMIAEKFLGMRIYEAETFINGRSKKTITPDFGPTIKLPKEIPFLNSAEFTIGGDISDKLSLNLVVYAEDNKVRVGLNLNDKFMENPDAQGKEYLKAVAGATKGEDSKKKKALTEKERQQIDKVVDKKNVKCGKGLGEKRITIFGYGEGEYTRAGLCEVSVNVHILLEAEGSLTHQTFVGPVPVYVRGEGKASMGSRGSLTANLVSKPSVSIAQTTIDLDIPLNLKVALKLGMGRYSLLSIGGGGSFELESLVRLRTMEANADLTASVLGEVCLTPWFHTEVSFVDATWHLYPGSELTEANNMDSNNMYEDYYDLDKYEIVSLSSLESYSSSGSHDDLIVDGKIVRGNTPRLMENSKGEVFAFYFTGKDDSLDNSGVVFTQIVGDGEGNDQISVPVRVAEAEVYNLQSTMYNTETISNNESFSAQGQADDESELVATPSNAAASPSNASVIYSTAKSRNAQSPVSDGAKAVNTANADIPSTADFYYDVYQNGDIIYIAVSKAKRSLEGMSAGSAEEITEIMKTSEIYLFQLDTQAKQVSFLKQLTNDENIDVSPTLYFDENGIHVAWLSVEPGEGGMLADDTSYIVNLWNEKSGTTEKHKVENNSRVADLAIGKLNGKVIAVYSADTDGNNATAEDMELFAYDGAKVTQMTDNKVMDNAPQFYNKGTRLMWNQNGAIYETSGVNGGSQIIDAGMSVAPGFRIIEGVNLYLAWEEVDSENNGVSIYMVQKKGDSWGDRFMVYQDEDYITSPVDGYVNNEGLNLLHINTDNVFERSNAGSALIFSRNLVRTDLSVEAITFDTDDVEIGEKLPISVYVKNNGNTVIREITLGVDDEELKTVSTTLNPGEEKELKLNEFIVPEIEEATEFTVFAQVSRVEGDEEAGNLGRTVEETGGSGSFELGYTDLAVDADLEIINGLNYLTVSVTNNSYMSSRANLRMQAESDMGMILQDELLETIPARTTRVKKYRLNDVENGFAIDKVAVVVVPEVAETMTENNVSIVYVGGLNERYRLNVETTEGGTVNRSSGVYDGSEIFDLKATPYEGYRFVRWECSLEGSVENYDYPETRFHMPGCDVTVKAVFQSTQDWKVQSITIQPSEITMRVGDNGSLMWLEVLPEDAGNKSVTWHSTDPKVATVDANGLVKGVARGRAEIYCVSNDGGNVESNRCTVTINGFSGGSGGSGGGGGGGGGGSSKGGAQGGGGPTTPTVLKDTYENSSWLQNADGTWKLLKEDGTSATGWAAKSNAWYYMDPVSQLMTTGWIFVDNVWYYMEPASGAMRTGWVSVNNVWYYLNPSGGGMVTGWVLIDNVWYYLNPSGGGMMTGWILIDNVWYYMDPVSGAMATGWKDINSKQYYFYTDGKLAVSTKTPDGFEVNGDGERIN